MRICKEDLLVNIFTFTWGIFDIYIQSEDMVNFHNLQGRLKAVTLTWNTEIIGELSPVLFNCSSLLYMFKNKCETICQ